MKTLGVVFSVLLPTLVLASLSAVEAQVRPVLQPSELCSDYPDYAIATFEDAELEAAIRAALSVRAREDLTCGLVSGLTALAPSDFSGIGTAVRGPRPVPAPVVPYESLAGIQNLTSLTSLGLYNRSISDISALSGLTSLRRLDLRFNPDLTDIRPLLDNAGFGVGDEVLVQSTNVSCSDVAALAATGVLVRSDCR